MGQTQDQTPDKSAEVPFGAVRLQYTEVAPIRVWGPVTGRPYDFSGAEPVHRIDARDAAILARSNLFRRAAS